MKPNELKKWLNASGMTREDLAKACRVSKHTVDGWFYRDTIPEPAGVFIEHFISEGLGISLTFSELKKVVSTMEKFGYDDITEFISDAVRAALTDGGKNLNVSTKKKSRRSAK